MGRSLVPGRVAVRVIAGALAVSAAGGGAGTDARAATCPQAHAEASALSPEERREAMTCVLNRRRAAAGARAVRPHPGLARVAGAHTADMLTNGFFGHVSSDNSRIGDRLRAAGVRFAKAGEVLAWACGGATPRAAVKAWLESPPHKAVILDGGYALVGVGATARAPGSCRSGATWTVVFARLL